MCGLRSASKAFCAIGVGLMKKLLIADYLGGNLVNRVFDFPNLYSASEVLIGVYAYALQLYYDFSGYTDIAIGSAYLLGVRLPRNFATPFLAPNIQQLWQRWHITLTLFLRDYVFLPLADMRKAARRYRVPIHREPRLAAALDGEGIVPERHWARLAEIVAAVQAANTSFAVSQNDR